MLKMRLAVRSHLRSPSSGWRRGRWREIEAVRVKASSGGFTLGEHRGAATACRLPKAPVYTLHALRLAARGTRTHSWAPSSRVWAVGLVVGEKASAAEVVALNTKTRQEVLDIGTMHFFLQAERVQGDRLCRLDGKGVVQKEERLKQWVKGEV